MNTIPLGGIIAIAVLFPNLLIVFYPPVSKLTNIPKQSKVLSQILIICERVGQTGSFILPFFYRLKCSTALDIILLMCMTGALVLYYAGWVRYLMEGRSEALFYKSMLGIPLPMAIMPVIYFILVSILLGSIWIMISVVLLGVGHITISRQHSSNIKL